MPRTKSAQRRMKISARLTEDRKGEFLGVCERAGVSESEAVRAYAEWCVAQNTVNPDMRKRT